MSSTPISDTSQQGLSDFFEVDSHFSIPYGPQSRKLKVLDWLYDLQITTSRKFSRVRKSAGYAAPKRVLIVGVEVPSRKEDIHKVMAKLVENSVHEITISIVPMGDQGKFMNIDDAIRGAAKPLSYFDWLVVTDDDIEFKMNFLNDLIGLATVADFALCQPAHAFRSHTTYAITKRHWKSLARETKYVEIGPLTLLRADIFKDFVPFPESRYCYAIDLLWTDLIERRKLGMGIIDGTPVRHLRPIAGSYDGTQAIDEARSLIKRYNITRNRDEFFTLNKVLFGS